ncbi:membrane protein insertion efficiency factor YidD [Candidatus Marinamargulisbacteria bacterium SCGC AG-343-D04]|nr:membrane protein insertion efficiency factor YidD [Candidatus Marinamargulisbacteria bacterium SCGC AG-343-D04]
MIHSFLKGLILFYRFCISPFKPRSCRFSPSCSEYAYEVVKNHGVLSSLSLIFKRLSKCHPWGSFGYDPAPSKSEL